MHCKVCGIEDLTVSHKPNGDFLCLYCFNWSRHEVMTIQSKSDDYLPYSQWYICNYAIAYEENRKGGM